jgi:hypothetical protein
MTWIFMMPYKFNASHRHKFEKKRHRVTNWRVYNEVLRLQISGLPPNGRRQVANPHTLIWPYPYA